MRMWHKVYLDDLFRAENYFFLSLRVRRHIVVSTPYVAIVAIPRAILMGLIFLFQPLFVSLLFL